MTDHIKLIELLNAFGVTPNIEVYPMSNKIMVSLDGNIGGVKGYSGFSCDFTFDLDGKFKEVGVWE